MKRWLYLIWMLLDLCPRFGHWFDAWRLLPSGQRKLRICQACALADVDPPFPKDMDRKEVKRAMAKREKKDRLKAIRGGQA